MGLDVPGGKAPPGGRKRSLPDASTLLAVIPRRLYVIPLLILPLALAGCQFSPWGGEARETGTPESIAEGDKGKSLLERKKARAASSARLPKGSLAPPDALPEGPAASVRLARFSSQDSAFGVLKANGVSRGEISSILRASRSSHPLSRVGMGNWYELVRSRAGVRRFLVQVDEARQLRVYRSRRGAFRARMERIPYTVKLVRLQVKVRSSFLSSVVKAGGSPSIAMELSEIFEWVIDFHKDLNTGDRVDALIERRFLHGRPAGFGHILSARFTVGGRKHAAVYFDRGGEMYYTPGGKTLRRAFLRSPLKYTRISSRFTKRRFHPILKRVRPHLGVDYAAPQGTPVRAVADGSVEWARWKGAAGKMIRLRHKNGYTTEYLHLSRFAEGIRRGRQVTQGKVIGYVGSTGLSTGPHLDYRIKHFGNPINPLSARSPAEWSIPREFRAEFHRVVRSRRAELARAPMLHPSADVVASASKRPERKEN